MVQCAGRYEKQARSPADPGTLKPMTARELDGVFCDELDDTTACILSQLYHDGLMEATSVEQTSVFEAAEH